jgi:hypothetical protein
MRRRQGEDLFDANGIVAPDQWGLSQLAYIAGEVVNEGVVVVD